jgi:hypothetical protein
MPLAISLSALAYGIGDGYTNVMHAGLPLTATPAVLERGGAVKRGLPILIGPGLNLAQ